MSAAQVTAAAEPGSGRRSRATLWWTLPVPLVLVLVPLTLALALGVDDTEFRVRYRTPRSLDHDTARLMLAGALALALGAGLAQLVPARAPGTPWGQLPRGAVDRLRVAGTLLFRTTLVGYVVLLLAAVARGLRPAAVVEVVVSGAPSEAVEDQFAPVTGVTTLTQVGVAYAVVAALLLLQGPDRVALRRLVVLALLALARAYLLTERLALIELLVPVVVVLAAAAAASPRTAVRGAARAAPLVLVPVLVLAFSLFEASRSYAFLGEGRQLSVLEYGADRLAGYYATSYNNGHLTLHDAALREALPYASLEAVWTAPLVDPSGLYEALNGYSYTREFSELLTQAGSPEFNSPGGLAIPFVDFGTVGGLVFLFAVGLLLGDAAQRFTHGQVVGLLAYPPLVTGLLELPRYLYWAQGRLVVPLVALLLTAGYLRSTRSTTPVTAASAASGR